ncbi:hypothetical protein H5410_014832 [Solanum commersonii]|uniref:Uncharacterized protein n=1 Tax=Solanum commersonii TaxID=4109 RepID=A0A9J5ZS55_SOLCO|nr:hypothetical protein H5410_014832 [Solanum commersonii]
MAYSNCGESNHNVRSCYKEKCTENNAYSKKGKRPMSDNEHGTDVEAETEATTQEFEPYDPDVEDEKDPPLRPMGKDAIPAGHVPMQAKKKRIKMMGVKGRGQLVLDDDLSTPNGENLFKIQTYWMAEAEITLSCSCCTTQIAGLNSRSISSSDSNKTRKCKSHVHRIDTKFSYNSQEVQANKEIH